MAVYLIRCDATGNTKIGYSRDPRSRLATLQTASPNRLRLVACFDGDESLEADLHQRFRDYRVNGEWFRLSENQVRAIAIEYGGADGHASLEAASLVSQSVIHLSKTICTTIDKMTGETEQQAKWHPANMDAEMGVLCGLMLDNSLATPVSARLEVTDFYLMGHRMIYRAILDLCAGFSHCDEDMLKDELKRREWFSRAGGDVAVDAILNAVPNPKSTLDYANIVVEKSILRYLIDLAKDLIKRAFSNAHSAEELVCFAKSAICDIEARLPKYEPIDVGTF